MPLNVTLLGHSSLWIESPDIRCLVDPVFFDPFEDGAVVSCPQRIVHTERLLRPDVVVISHRHPDHLDVPSLALVPRDCLVLCPEDPLVLGVLRAMGFVGVRSVRAGETLALGDFEMYFTDSEVLQLREVGIAFRSGDACVWNQVDTFASEKSAAGVVNFARGAVDVHIAKHASQNYGFFDDRRIHFPFAEHAENLANVLRIGARTVVPGAGGFRFADRHAWLNRFLFPVSRRRFLADVRQVSPHQSVCNLNPGDVLRIAGGAVTLEPASSPLASMVADDETLKRFEPTSAVPELFDPDEARLGAAALDAEIERLVPDDFLAFLNSGPAAGAVEPYHRRGALYVLGAVYPGEGKECFYSFSFRGSEVRLRRRRSPGEWDVLHRIAASALLDLLGNRRSLFYVRAYSRRVSRLYQLSGTGSHLRLEAEPEADLFTAWLRHRTASLPLAVPMPGEVFGSVQRSSCITTCGLSCAKEDRLTARERALAAGKGADRARRRTGLCATRSSPKT